MQLLSLFVVCTSIFLSMFTRTFSVLLTVISVTSSSYFKIKLSVIKKQHETNDEKLWYKIVHNGKMVMKLGYRFYTLKSASTLWFLVVQNSHFLGSINKQQHTSVIRTNNNSVEYGSRLERALTKSTERLLEPCLNHQCHISIYHNYHR